MIVRGKPLDVWTPIFLVLDRADERHRHCGFPFPQAAAVRLSVGIIFAVRAGGGDSRLYVFRLTGAVALDLYTPCAVFAL
jgi:hypothetical protein